MVSDSARRIKRYLEAFYDIPFDVEGTMHYKDAWFDIKPQNSARELFDIDLRFKNQLRMVIEVTPEKYAAFSIQDMASASIEKKRIFAEYARQLQERKAKTEFFINESPCDATDPESWPDRWTNYRLRVSRSPICAEDEQFDEIEITSSWSAIVAGMFLSLLNVITVEENDQHLEGGVKKVEANRYERNPINRALCLAANGYECKICGFDFEKEYGDIGHHFIHVHHIVPVSTRSEAYLLDPVKDLIPVCPNCHAMLHRCDPPMLPEELQAHIRRIKDAVKGND